MSISFEKYQGLGNDYLVYDPAGGKLELNEARIRLICDRNFGFGSDGILVLEGDESTGFAVRIYNPDGSEAEKSGNGVRIFAKFLKDFGYVGAQSLVLKTKGGNVDVQYLNEDGSLMKVLMGKPTYKSDEIPVAGAVREVVDEKMEFAGRQYAVTCLSIGNPHCVIPLDEISGELAKELGRVVETASYFPNRINMQLLKVIDQNNIEIEIYERGAGYTLASGSSSCAAASAAHKLGLTTTNMTVHMPGGQLEIEIMPDESIYMTGTAGRIGTAVLSDEFIAQLMKL